MRQRPYVQLKREGRAGLGIFLKYLFLFWFGGSFYVTLEVFYRGYSHWTMFLLSGGVFLAIGWINQRLRRDIPFLLQIALGTAMAVGGEFFTGCVVNLLLGWNVWDYSQMWGNVLGQICPRFAVIWIPVSALAIVVDDLIRWRFFHEPAPRYRLL